MRTENMLGELVCVLFPALPGEGWAECKVRPPCSEKDYFQIHTACDSQGRVGSPGRGFFPSPGPPPSVTSAGLFVFCRRRCCIGGWSLKSAWRTPPEPWSCPRWGRGSRAPPATPGTTTATTPPVYPAPLERTPTAPRVSLDRYRGNGFWAAATAQTCVDEASLLQLNAALVVVCPRMHRVSRGDGAGAGLRVQVVERAASQHEDFLFQRGQLQV